jgi:RNA 3'-terminal phosphate cyclase (GTP)
MLVLEIDGSTGEGGGQILRTALVLSLLTRKPFHMHSIRAGRDKPGLKAQHVHILEALRRLSASEVRGAREGGSDVSFVPAPVTGGRLALDIGTAGSITLLLQSLLPAATLGEAPTELDVSGGTDVRWSPTMDYFREILAPLAPGLSLDVRRRGFYPRGGGRVVASIQPRPVAPIHRVERSRLKRILIRSVAAKELEKARVAERQIKGARRILSSYRTSFEESTEYCDSFSTSTAVTVVAEFERGERLGADALGERGKPAEDVGEEAARRLMEEMRSEAPVDRHAGDHLVLWLALAGQGAIRVSEMTEHTRTNLWTCEQFLGPVFRIEDRTIYFAAG